VFASNPKVYSPSYVIVSSVILAFPTALVAYNTMRSLVFHDFKEAIKQTLIVIFQLSSYFMAKECVENCMESAEMLDYKFTEGVYKTIPQISLQMFAMFQVGALQGTFDPSVLVSIMLSIISITVIFIMLFDRKEARRMSMHPYKNHPACACWLADAFALCGMGNDGEDVQGLVNFNSFYTSHYTWSYVFQLFSIISRSVALTWLLAVTENYSFLILAYLVGGRLLLIMFFDSRTCKRPLTNNLVSAIALAISDSAWEKDEDHPLKSRNSMIFLFALTTAENVVSLTYTVFYFSQSLIPHHISVAVFVAMMVTMFLRLVLVFHWLLPIHFPKLVLEGDSSIVQMLEHNTEKKMNDRRAIGQSQKRRQGIAMVRMSFGDRDKKEQESGKDKGSQSRSETLFDRLPSTDDSEAATASAADKV
jgi:hypothetical protein